jgi:hypothetical protein
MSKIETNGERSTETENQAVEGVTPQLSVSTPRADDVTVAAESIPSSEGGVVKIVLRSPHVEGDVILSNDEAELLADRIRTEVRRNRS